MFKLSFIDFKATKNLLLRIIWRINLKKRSAYFKKALKTYYRQCIEKTLLILLLENCNFTISFQSLTFDTQLLQLNYIFGRCLVR